MHTVADGLGQPRNLVVGEREPAQQRRERLRAHAADLVGLEADHAQVLALPQHRWQFGELVVRAKQNAQLVQARQIMRQRSQGVA